MSSMSDRKAELERKKAKLQALREEKDRRRREKEQKDAEEALQRASAASSLDSRRDLDEMLSSLGVAPVKDVLSSLSSMTSLTPPQTASPDASLPHTDKSSLPSHGSQRASAASSLDSRRDLDEMLSSLGVAPVKDVLSSLSSMTSLTPPQTASPDASLPHTDKSSLPSHGGVKKPNLLQVVSVQSTDIPPKENVTYAKQTQTTASGVTELRDGYMEDWWRPRKAHATDYYDEYNLNPGLEWEDEFTVLTFDGDGARQGDDEEAAFHGKLPPGILPHGLPTVKEVQPAVTAAPVEKKEEEKEKKVRELSVDEKQTIMLSAEFQRFISRAGRVIERALAESVDIYTDYTGGGDAENALDDKSDARLSLVRTFYDERWSRGRCVTCLDWSAAHPELMLASYHNSDDAPHDPDGVCLVWNTKFKKNTPEDIFHCQSPVMSATFARFHPNLILGGTYSGQIVLWDNRVQKRTPVQRTPLSSLAHTHPVYCLSVVGSQNAHNLISVSTDGRMCTWSLDMLSAPQETLELQHRQSKAVAVTCMGFPHGDVNNFVLGSEDGNMYTDRALATSIASCWAARTATCIPVSGCCWDMLSAPQETLELQHRQSKAVAVTCMGFPHGDVNNFVLGSEDGNMYTGSLYGQRAGVSECIEAHAGPVTALSWHAAPAAADLAHLYLTASVDWSVKLWSSKGPVTALSWHAAPAAADLAHLYLTASVDWSVKLWSSKENKALYSFEDSGDYVSDVRWSPAHPALFAAVDAAGRLDLWNLNRDTEVPIASIQAEGGVAFNRVSWTPAGTHVTAGDDAGKIWVYELAEHVAQPRHDEWTKFVYTLQELRNNQADEESDRLSLAASGPPSLTSLTSLASNPLR